MLFGAPGDVPPCIRQRPFVIAGDRQGVPVLVRARQRGLKCICNLLCTGLFLRFRMSPLPRGFDHADDSLATRMHVDVLHRDFLLALAAMARFEEGGVRSGLKRPIYCLFFGIQTFVFRRREA